MKKSAIIIFLFAILIIIISSFLSNYLINNIEAQSIITIYGIFGFFLLTFISSLTIIFPIPAFSIIFLFSGFLKDPFQVFLLGFSSGLGSALGEITGYALGFGGREIISKDSEKLEKIKKKIDKYGVIFIFLFAISPFPFDIIGILAGIIKYDFKKFIIATILGKIVKYLIICYAGFFSIKWIIDIFIRKP